MVDRKRWDCTMKKKSCASALSNKKNVKNENGLAIKVTHIKQGTSCTKRKWLSTTKESSYIKEHTKK